MRGLAAVGAGLAVGFVVDKLKNAYEESSLPLIGEPCEEGFFKAKVHEVEIEGKTYVPVIRKEPKLDNNIVESEDFVKFGISLDSELEGQKVYGGTYNGIYGVIERDSFIINYLNRIESPIIIRDEIYSMRLRKIFDILQRYKLEVLLLDLTLDIKIPTVGALILDRTGRGPAISVGLKSGFNMIKVIEGAIDEALMTRSWIRDNMSSGMKRKIKEIRTIEDRAFYWANKNMIPKLNFWIKSKKRSELKILNGKKDSSDFLKEALCILKRKNIDVYYVDVATKMMKELRIHVVKVIIPFLHPLYLDEKYQYLGGQRLYRVPLELGLLGSERTSFNKIPHPFL